MSKVILILLLVINNGNLFGQYFSRYDRKDSVKISAINKYRYEVDLTDKKSDSVKSDIDSAEVIVKKFNNKIETTSLFKKSKSVLFINYYFKECELVMVSVKEPSPLISELAAYSEFYFEHDSIFSSDYYFTVRVCMLMPKNMSTHELYGYNPGLSGEKLKAYVRKLSYSLKAPANNSLLLAGPDK